MTKIDPTLRCALFAGHCYYPEGGASDFRAFGTIAELKELYEKNADSWSSLIGGAYPDPWGQIANAQTMELIIRIEGTVAGGHKWRRPGTWECDARA